MIKELSKHTLTDVVRLHSLVRLASAPAQSNRASRVASEAVAALDAQACAFYHLADDGRTEAIAVHTQRGIESDMLSQLVSLLLGDVEASRHSLIKNDLEQELPDDPLVAAGIINNYLSVPLFDSKGTAFGVAAVLSGASRPFDESDLWWLEMAAHLASAAFTCESLQEKLSALEREVESPQSGSTKPAHTTPGQEEQTSQPDKLSVLVVDDDRSVNSLIQRFLTRQGHQADSASDGLEALRMFQPSAYDVVISDIVMPGMSGWELIASLRSREPKLPIIIITGYSSNNNGVWNKDFLKTRGVAAVLNKPLDFDYLAAVLEDFSMKKRQPQRKARIA
jgi:CheY-like chemotaxis protein